MGKFEIQWRDHGREPQCVPDPAYPLGIDLDRCAAPKCKATLPWPAKRCGHWVIKCLVCGCVGACTTAGRPDDPRSMTLPCQIGTKH